MSGIAGILNTDGAPVNQELLSAMTQYMAFRGPDAQQSKLIGYVGLGNTLFRTARESAGEQQPASLDGKIWITSDARIDARSELIEKLKAKGREVSLGRPDVELILHSYHVWGCDCVDHLLGDFAFAIWDGPAQRLFCARDHIGFKLFFYAHTGNSLVFSNTLNCVRMHPAISDKLNELAIADFLLSDSNQDLATTAFLDIYRLPPAHTLVFENGALTIRRYWTMPEQEEVRYKHPQECVERFREVMDSATGDRLRGESAGLLLSGGLDSPTVAASARRVADRHSPIIDLHGYTFVFEQLVPHEERYYASLVGKALNIPIEFAVGDEGLLYDNYALPDFQTPQPWHLPMGYSKANQFEQIEGAHIRTVLTGYGGDPVLSTSLSQYFRRLAKAKQFGRLIGDVARFMAAEGRFSRLYLGLRLKRLIRRFRKQGTASYYPAWLNPELEKRLDLRTRLERIYAQPNVKRSARPEGYVATSSPQWAAVFEPWDPNTTRHLIELYHPFFDLRVIQFMLALPALPWCSDKEILRQAARGVLPDRVRLRRKSPMIEDPIMVLLQRPESAWVDHFEAVPELSQYVVRSRIPPVHGQKDSGAAWINLRPLSLNFWLQSLHPISYKYKGGGPA